MYTWMCVHISLELYPFDLDQEEEMRALRTLVAGMQGEERPDERKRAYWPWRHLCTIQWVRDQLFPHLTVHHKQDPDDGLAWCKHVICAYCTKRLNFLNRYCVAYTEEYKNELNMVSVLKELKVSFRRNNYLNNNNKEMMVSINWTYASYLVIYYILVI